MADDSAFIGGLVGGMLGSAISNAQKQQQPAPTVRVKRKVVRKSPGISAYQREENRRVQTSLNYFGFDAGVPDGVFGRNSRAAAARYQAFMGYPPTGRLSDYERIFLTSSYDRALVGGPQISQTMSASGQGVRGLLLAFRQEQMGTPPAYAANPQAPAAAPAPSKLRRPPPRRKSRRRSWKQRLLKTGPGLGRCRAFCPALRCVQSPANAPEPAWSPIPTAAS